MKARVTIAAILLAICGWSIFLRQPAIDDFFCDPDVAGVAYSSRELLIGGDLYADTVETKPPLSYLLYAGIFRLGGLSISLVYWLGAVWHLGVLLVLYALAAAMAGRGAGICAALAYSFFSVGQSANGVCPNFETWTLLPLAVGYWRLWRLIDRYCWTDLFLAGICLGVAVLAKQNVLVTALPAVVWLAAVLAEDNNRPAGRRIAFGLIVALGGLLLPFGAVAGYFAARDGLASMVRVLSPTGVMGYMASESSQFLWDQLRVHGGNFLFQFGALLAVAFLMFFAYSRPAIIERLGRHYLWGSRLAATWFVGAVAAVMIGTKFFDHYYVLLLPPLALMVALGVWPLARHWRLSAGMGAVLLGLTAALFVLTFRWEILIARQALEDRVRIGRLNFTEECDYFYRRPNLPRLLAWNRHLAATGFCLRENTSPDETIYVWDYEPGLYWFADRRAPTRHFMYFDVAVELPEGAGRWHTTIDERVRASRGELLADLIRTPPAYLVTLRAPAASDPPADYRKPPAPLFPELADFLTRNYHLDEHCSNRYFLTYRRLAR